MQSLLDDGMNGIVDVIPSLIATGAEGHHGVYALVRHVMELFPRRPLGKHRAIDETTVENEVSRTEKRAPLEEGFVTPLSNEGKTPRRDFRRRPVYMTPPTHR